MFSISDNLKKKIERLQKISFFVILGKEAKNDYTSNMTLLDATTLEQRRVEIAENFAKKVLKHPEHRKIFEYTNNSKTRLGKRVIVPLCKNARYEKSTIPALAKIINKKFTHKI